MIQAGTHGYKLIQADTTDDTLDTLELIHVVLQDT